MIDESAAVLPLWMLMSAAFGFMIGEACGNDFRHRKCLEQVNEDLRDELEKARSCEVTLHQQLKQQRGVIHNIHKRICAVTKGVEKTTP